MTACTTTVSAPGAAGKYSLVCRVEDSLEPLAAMRAQWDEFVELAGGDIYFAYDWCRVYWRHYGHGRDLRVFIFHAGSRLVGIVPLVIERLWVGPLPIPLARLLGADWTPAVLHPPVRSDYAEAVYRTVIDRVLRDFGCDATSFARLSGEFATAENLQQACRQTGSRVALVCDRPVTVHSVLHLPATFEAYLAGLSRNERGSFRREQRRLEEAGPVKLVKIGSPDEIGPAFERFVALHQAQWAECGKQGHFQDWPGSLNFTRELLWAFAPLGRAEIVEVTVGQTVVAMQLNLLFGSSACWRLSARRLDAVGEHHGLGRVALIRQIEAAIEAGTRRIEAGSGHYPYKLRLGGAEYPLRSVLIARNRWWPRLKTCLLAAYADLLNLLYYRIWFCRLAPRLPLPRKPLWKSWIRTRV